MNTKYTRLARYPARLLGLLLVTLLLLSTMPHQVHAQNNAADLDVILWLSPASNRGSNVAAPGDLLYLDVRIENVGDGDATNVRVTVPYDRNIYLLTHNPAEVGENDFTVVKDHVPARTFKTIRVELRIRNDIPLPSRIDLYGDYTWDDARGGGDGTTNQVSLVVNYNNGGGNGNDDGIEIIDIPRDTRPPDTCFLGMLQDNRGVTLVWGGTDDVSGIRSYDIQVQELPNGRWQDWKVRETATSAWFGPLGNAHFAFRVRARDNQGNEEAWSLNPQLTTVESDFERSRCPAPGETDAL